ncbi:Ig-like domain-containing protein [Patulibacter sp. SYSU D01012]|uniref:Ig-like domain-containing protein n=1 Tax=Patulibacter sp. SYSU D01012 TaxID=2817381 RepID=UPI001B3091A3|nr:Ig-like domain-containing protein [Patulibacter sp. SYSU D01012]
MPHRLVVRAVLPALAGAAALTSTAAAAPPTVLPTPEEARTFATTNGGWTSAVDYGGLACIPGVTCPTATPSYRSTGGFGGAADGHLRDTFGTLLGVLGTTTITWTSPSFAAPSGTDVASLSVKVRPQIASLLAIGSVRLTRRLVDVNDPASSTALPDVSLSAASASFGTQTVVVPPSALVAGRTYRLALGVAVTTNVSAVTSGNVDLDDVALTLESLAGPRDLTASVPATGPLRVTGSVDAHGLDTSVTVEYGTTTSYGATTTAVQLPGSTTGPQPFSVPLTGLQPGQTYHYRVRAENAEGPVTTADATFVAPSPPSTAAPTISGAGNARTRTVTFSRASDVTDAVVELLDAGGAVQQSWPDAGNDGTEVITLPDADGTYDVRVRRTTNRALESTSAVAQATLDRTGPDTSGLELAVTPVASPEIARTVTLNRPSDATTVTAQVLDADGAPVGAATTVTGGSAQVQLGSTDGTYRVRVTLTDAAGNDSVVTSPALTLDRQAPDAGPAPTITGDGNARGRTVTFTRDASATDVALEVLGADGTVLDTVAVPSGDSGEITLPDADGAYAVRVRQADAAGNVDRSPTAPAVLDRVAPQPGPAPTVTGDQNGRTRSVAFTRASDAATVAVEIRDADDRLVDSVAVPSGDRADVTLPDVDGTYTVRVRQTDAAGNDARTPGTDVVLDRQAPDPGPAPTVDGSATGRERTVRFVRDPSATTVTVELLDADGGLLDAIAVPSGDEADVTLPDRDGAYGIRVRQVDAAGNVARTPTAEVVLDREAPDPGPAPTVPSGTDGTAPFTVSFVRDPSAAEVRVEVLDASGTVVATVPVPSGDTATVTLPAAAGAYTIRVVQVDAAGNSAVTAATTVERRVAGPETPATPQTPTTPQGTTPTTPADPPRSVLDAAECPRPTTAVTTVARAGGRIVVRGYSSSPRGTKLAVIDGRNRRVGTAVVGADGRFGIRVAPTAKLRRNDVRYRVVDRGRSSIGVQLHRANALTAVRRSGGTVTLRGRVDLRRIGRARSILAFGGAGACPDPRGTLRPVGRARIDAKGRYRLTVRAEATGRLLVGTRVRGSRASARSAYVVR